jgi:hypothetical protein
MPPAAVKAPVITGAAIEAAVVADAIDIPRATSPEMSKPMKPPFCFFLALAIHFLRGFIFFSAFLNGKLYIRKYYLFVKYIVNSTWVVCRRK